MAGKSLLYVFDPLCGWCYGFSSVVRRLHEETHERASWEVLSGGMVVGPQVTPIGRMAGFLRTSWPRVSQTTGVEFGSAFTSTALNEGTMVLSSLEPSRGLQVVKKLAPELAMQYASATQNALYHDGKDISRLAILDEIAARFGLASFEVEYLKTESHDNTIAEFDRVAAMGIKGFPTLVGKQNESLFVFSRGYAPYERLSPLIELWLDAP